MSGAVLMGKEDSYYGNALRRVPRKYSALGFDTSERRTVNTNSDRGLGIIVGG